jgi:hypothetical protein
MALRDGVELPRQAGVRRRLDGDGVLDGPGGSAEAAEGKSVIYRCPRLFPGCGERRRHASHVECVAAECRRSWERAEGSSLTWINSEAEGGGIRIITKQ